MFRLQHVLRLLCLAVLASCAWANTTMGRGIIVSAGGEGDRGGPSILVQNEFSTPYDREDSLVRWFVAKDAVITLDGVKADFSAFVPGRLVFLCKDCQIFKVFSRPFLFPAAATTDPSNAWWTVRLPVKVVQPGGKDGSDLILHLAVQGGAVVRAVALTPGWSPAYGSSAAWHAVDPSGLKVAAGRLAGTCTITLMDRGLAFANGKPAEDHALTLDLATDGKGTATCDGKAIPGPTVICRAAPTIADEWYCFLRAPDPAGSDPAKKNDNLRLELRRQQGAIAQSAFRHGYGKPGPGPAATRCETAVAGTTLTITVADAKTAYDLKGMIIGDRVFGTYTAKEGERTWEGRFSAYLRQADAPSVGWDERTAKKEAAALKGGTP